MATTSAFTASTVAQIMTMKQELSSLANHLLCEELTSAEASQVMKLDRVVDLLGEVLVDLDSIV